MNTAAVCLKVFQTAYLIDLINFKTIESVKTEWLVQKLNCVASDFSKMLGNTSSGCSEGLLQIAEDTLKSIVRKDSIREFYQIDNKTPLGRYVNVIWIVSSTKSCVVLLFALVRKNKNDLINDFRQFVKVIFNYSTGFIEQQ